MSTEAMVMYLVLTVVAALMTGVGLIYLADYIYRWNIHRPWKLAKRTWDYTEKWDNITFYLKYAQIQLNNPGIRYREKQGRLNLGDGW